MSDFRARRLAALAAKIATLETGGRTDRGVLPFGVEDMDACLPGGGLGLGRWHEIVGEGLETETCVAPSAFAALTAAPLCRKGEAVWVLRRDDLWAPGLAGLGFPPERLIQVCARDEAETLAIMEDALSTVGVSAVFGEVEAVDLTAGRVRNVRSGAELTFVPPPNFIMEMIVAGGVYPLIKRMVAEGRLPKRKTGAG